MTQPQPPALLSFSQTWTISNFPLLVIESSQNHRYLESPEFWHSERPNFKARMHLYPNGRHSRVEHFISLYVFCEAYAASEEIPILVSLGILEPDGTKWNPKVIQTNISSLTETGFSQFILRHFLLDPDNKFLQNGSLSLYLEISILISNDSPPFPSIQNLRHSSNVKTQNWKHFSNPSELTFQSTNHPSRELIEIPNKLLQIPEFQILNKTRQISMLRMESLAFTEIATEVSEEPSINASPKTPLSADSFELYLSELRQFNQNAHPLTIKYLSNNSTASFDKISCASTVSSSPNTLETQENSKNLTESFNIIDSIDLEYSLPTPPQSSITSQSIPSFESLFSQSSFLAAYERRLLKKLRRLKISQILQKNARITKNRFIYHFESSNLQNVILNAHSSVQMENIELQSTEFSNFPEFINLIPILLGFLLVGRMFVKRCR